MRPEPSRNPIPSTPQRPRRKLPFVPGRDYSEATGRTALLLMNTYEAERRRHLNLKASTEQIEKDNGKQLRKGTKFKQDLGELTARVDAKQVNLENRNNGRVSEHAGFWLQLATRVIEARMDPERFIRRQFTVLDPFAKPPFPQSLDTPQAFRNYKLGFHISVAEVRIALTFQTAKFPVACHTARRLFPARTSEELWGDVLASPQVELSALFRYGMASSIVKQPGLQNPERFRQLMETYELAASLQYVIDADAYDQMWGDELVPPGFRQLAERRYLEHHGVRTTPEVFE